MSALFPLPEAAPIGWSINRLAAELRVDRRVVTARLDAAGVKPIKEHRGDALYSLADACRAIFEAPTIGATQDLQRRRLEAQTEVAEIEMREKRGELLNADAVRRAMFAKGRLERDALANWPTRAGPIIAAEFSIDPVRLTASLERELRQHMEDRADAPFDGTRDLLDGLGEGLPS